MHGIVSLLDQQHSRVIEGLWQRLEEHCDLMGIKITPFPHFSWQIAEDYEWSALERALAGLAAEIKPFAVHTSGLAFFTGDKPVIFTPVVRSPALSDLHERLWEHLSGLCINPSPYYAPEAWVPHVSLAHSDVTIDNIDCAIDLLAYRACNWRFWIDNLAVIFQPAGKTGTLWNRFSLQG